MKISYSADNEQICLLRFLERLLVFEENAPILYDRFREPKQMFAYFRLEYPTIIKSSIEDQSFTLNVPDLVNVNVKTSGKNFYKPKSLANTSAYGVTAKLEADGGIKLKGTNTNNEDVAGAIRHVQPPIFQSQYFQNIGEMATSTLSDSGANDAALGNIRPDNATAIIQMREAALQPLQIYQNRFYDFIEQLARIWADFWINLYGSRMLRTVTKEGTNYIPFDGDRYKNLVITARIDVGAATLWSEAVVISTLDNLLERQLINFSQYLDRMPAGIIPDVTGLKEDLQIQAENQKAQAALSDEAILQDFAAQQPELFAQYQQMPPEQQQAMLAKIKGAYNGGENIEAEGDLQ